MSFLVAGAGLMLALLGSIALDHGRLGGRRNALRHGLLPSAW